MHLQNRSRGKFINDVPGWPDVTFDVRTFYEGGFWWILYHRVNDDTAYTRRLLGRSTFPTSHPRPNEIPHMEREDSSYQSSDQGKVRTSKKRPKRGGCIPCSKRRQKCDRVQPCASCVDRGIAHLCKWESIPGGPNPSRSAAASPVDVGLTPERADDGGEDDDEIPQALKDTKLDLDESGETLKMLSQRIQSLENWVVGSKESVASGSKSTGVYSSSMTADISGDVARFEEGFFQAGSSFDIVSTNQIGTGGFDDGPPASTSSGVLSPLASPQALQQARYSEGPPGFGSRVSSVPDESYNQVAPFSLVHHGEYLGPGNVLGSLHSIRSPLSDLRLPAGSMASATIPVSHPTRFAQTLIPAPEIQHLVQYIPGAPAANVMVDAFFKEVNWRYGIPEHWFKNLCSQMWAYSQNTSQNQELSRHWLCLFFAVLACAPQPGETPFIASRLPNTHDSLTYFACASIARRLAEDDVLDRPLPFLPANTYFHSPVDGSVLVSLAIPLLCDFLAERGRISEAWELVGNGVRSAQTIGLHRDPRGRLWQEMPEEEKELRRKAWWGLYIWDSFLSHILGRPHMINRDTCDVEKPSAGDMNNQRASFNLSRMVLIQLADIACDVLDKLSMGTDQFMWMVLSEVDAKLHNWKTNIPLEFRTGTTQEQDFILFSGVSQPEFQNFLRHRYMITTWYHFIRLKFGTLATSQPPPAFPVTGNSSNAVHWAEKCLQSALELITFQCDTFDHLRRTQFGERWVGENWYFEGCLSLLEAAVALVLVLTKYPTTFLLPPGANMVEESRTGLKLEYMETTRILSRTINVFSEIVMNEGELKAHAAGEGKRTEIASKGLQMLQILLKEHWWKLDPRTGKPSPTIVCSRSHSGFTTLRGSVSPAGSRASQSMTGLSPGVDMASAAAMAYKSSPLGSLEGSTIPSQASPALSTGQIQQPSPYSTMVSPVEMTPMTPSTLQPVGFRPPSSAYYANAPQLPAAIRAQLPSYFQESSPHHHRPPSQTYIRDTGIPTPSTSMSSPTFRPLSSQSQAQSAPLASTSYSGSILNYPVANAYDTTMQDYATTHPSFVSPPPPQSLSLPPPNQGMRMIHYIAPGMKSRTTAKPTVFSAYEPGVPGSSGSQQYAPSEQAGEPDGTMKD